MHIELIKLAKEVVGLRKENKELKKSALEFKAPKTVSIAVTPSIADPSTESPSLSIEEELSLVKPVKVNTSTNSDSCTNCEKLLEEKERLTTALERFTRGSDMLKTILKTQKAYTNRAGIGYEPKHKVPKKWVEPKVKPYLKYFRKSSEWSSPYSFCNFCNRKGHTQSACNARKYGLSGSYKWVPKGTHVAKDFTSPKPKTNPKGPKRIWVPKSV